MARRFFAAAFLGSLFSLLPSGFAQPPAIITPRVAAPASVETLPVVRVESSLVVIPAHVTNSAGAPVLGLRKENFRVSEDNVAQSIAHFAEDDAPASIGILFDASGSMRNKIQTSAQAAAAFFLTANPEDEFFLVKFNDSARLAVALTPQPDLLRLEIARTHPFGQTALLDAIHLALGHLKKAHHPRKALVIISDGGDNWSRHSVVEVKNALLEGDVQVYAMGIFDAAGRTAEERRGPRLLEDLAALTGGRNLPVERLGDLPAIGAQIGRELRAQYVLGYYSTNTRRDGKYRHIKVTLNVPDTANSLRADYRPGYYGQ